MSSLSLTIVSRVALVCATVVHPAACDQANAQSAGQPAQGVSQLRENAARLVARIRRADYDGDREELRRLVEELGPKPQDAAGIASRVHYWRGFALWRRAFNGFNVSADREDLAADLEGAVAEFEQALSFDPALVDAKVGTLSCLQNLAFLHREDAAKLGGLVKRFVPLLEELSARAGDHPRFLWVQGASLWYALPGLSDAQIAERRARAVAGYEHGLQIARSVPAPSDPLEPAWGEPELLMSLSWSHLNARQPDLALAETYARQALALVPHWHFVRSRLLPQIQQTQAQRRLDVFVGRWTARGRTYAEAFGPAAGETAGVAIHRRTARDNWLLSEVTLDGAMPYGVTVLMAPTPDGTYVAVAVNNLAADAMQYSGRWLDDGVLELDAGADTERRQRVRYTFLSETQLELLVTESRDGGRTYHRHSFLALSKEWE